jgi:hypothetical protein
MRGEQQKRAKKIGQGPLNTQFSLEKQKGGTTLLNEKSGLKDDI